MTTNVSWIGWAAVLGAACTGGGSDKDPLGHTGSTDADTDTDTDADTDADTDTDTDTDPHTGGPDTLEHFDVLADAGAACAYDDCLGNPALAVGSDGTAYAAWIHDDPNGDGDASDGVVEFASSDGGSSWGPVTVLGPAGDLWGVDQLDLTQDPITGELVACWSESPPSGPGAVHLASSTDGGATWVDGVLGPLPELNPAWIDCDARDGEVAVATEFALFVRDSSFNWTQSEPPHRTFDLAAGPVATAIRPSDGAVFYAFFDEPPAPASYDRSVYLWTPSSLAPAMPVLSSGGRQNDSFEVDLRFDGDTSWLSVQLDLDGSNDSIWLMSSDDQANWSDEASIQEEGGQEFGSSGFPGAMDLSAAAGRVSLALQVVGATSGSPACLAPKLVDTVDGTTFDLCNLTNAAENVAGFGVQLGEDATGRRQVLFVAVDPYGPLPTGLIHWVE